MMTQTLPGRLLRSDLTLTTAPGNGRAAEITPSLRDREGAYADLRDIQDF
ncbi:hypothetical protein [Salinivibrio socompensis]|nr:hypothetical protein [Salinivibrio socompensis]